MANISYSQDRITLNLESAIILALKENTDIAIASYQVKINEFALKEAKGYFLPKLNLSANYYRSLDRQVIFLPDAFGMEGPTKLGSDNDYRASLNLAVPVYSSYNSINKTIAETRLKY